MTSSVKSKNKTEKPKITTSDETLNQSNVKKIQMPSKTTSLTSDGLQTTNTEEIHTRNSNQAIEISKSVTQNDFTNNRMLHLSYQLVYQPCNLCCSKPKKDEESKIYSGHDLRLNSLFVKFRVGKSTPTKIGHFVTIYKRASSKSPIQPYDVNDPADLVVVCVQNGNKIGQFVFPKSTLAVHDVFSQSGKGGKRAIRVYAPWIKTTNSQAAQTQNWQKRYFLDLSNSSNINLDQAKKLYGFN